MKMAESNCSGRTLVRLVEGDEKKKVKQLMKGGKKVFVRVKKVYFYYYAKFKK